MAVRYPASKTNAAEVRDALREHIDPGQTGLVFSAGPRAGPAGRGGMAESDGLGQLFLGMSIFWSRRR